MPLLRGKTGLGFLRYLQNPDGHQPQHGQRDQGHRTTLLLSIPQHYQLQLTVCQGTRHRP
jgi:hypothetical protein